MSDRYVVGLHGCTPEPLMSYLKALGVLRLVAEQADSEALGRWERDEFVLDSRLDSDELTSFLLTSYKPTPILGPWAGGSGFFGKDNRDAVNAIAESRNERLAPYREAIEAARRILRAEGLSDKPSGEEKSRLLRRYRREMPDAFVQWMDAAIALGEEKEWFAPLLGTGGNDGRLDFTQNFMQRVADLRLHEDRPRAAAAGLLNASLFGEPVAGLGKASVGQFAPGRAGGPNATQGMEGGSLDNPWDYLLGLEGSLALAGAAVRRFSVDVAGRAAFPFTVASRPVGETTSSDDEATEARGELWFPLWERGATFVEVRLLFSEGRAEVGGRPARDAVEFSRAVAGLGVDRGIGSFSRYGLFKRSGKAYLAVPSGRFGVPKRRREGIDLLLQIDRWLGDFRVRVKTDAPQRLQAAERRIESRIFDYCRYGRTSDLLAVLTALGAAERELAVTAGHRGGKQICPPIPTLKPEWVEAVADRSVEFEIALALADISGEDGAAAAALRANLEPVRRQGRRWVWDEGSKASVWGGAGLAANFLRILDRRLLEQGTAGLHARRHVRLASVAQFLGRETDDQKIADLLWGLALVDTRWAGRLQFGDPSPPPLPRAYAWIKPLFLPLPLAYEDGRWKLDESGAHDIQLEPGVLPLIRAGRIPEACTLAARRLLVSGIPPVRHGARTPAGEAEVGLGVDPIRLAAALLIPISDGGLSKLLGLVAREPSVELQGVS